MTESSRITTNDYTDDPSTTLRPAPPTPPPPPPNTPNTQRRLETCWFSACPSSVLPLPTTRGRIQSKRNGNKLQSTYTAYSSKAMAQNLGHLPPSRAAAIGKTVQHTVIGTCAPHPAQDAPSRRLHLLHRGTATGSCRHLALTICYWGYSGLSSISLLSGLILGHKWQKGLLVFK